MTYASVEDVAKAVGRSIDSVTQVERDQWDYWLSVVERSIGAAFRKANLNLTVAIAAGSPSPDDVADVEVAAVVRKVQNPTWGQTSRTISHAIDDASGTETSRNEGAGAYKDPLNLLPEELDWLLPGIEPDPTAYTVRPTFAPDSGCWP
jgi:hypothetical protein